MRVPGGFLGLAGRPVPPGLSGLALSLFFAVLATAFLLSTACQGDRDTASAGSASPASAIPAGALSSGTDVMCVEHGVLEAVCTQCNPKLIPIFQARGDWCAEHQFPESFCPICSPEAGGKPGVAVAGEEPPADGLRIRFRTKEVAQQAGLETARTREMTGEAAVSATATLVADAGKSAVVNTPAPGVIRALRADLGARVARGDLLVEIESAEVAETRSRLHSARARLAVAESSFIREQELQKQGISPLKDLQAAEQAVREAQSEVGAASAGLVMVGTGEGETGRYGIRAPIAGVITRRNVSVGTFVDMEEVLFEILDTSTLWADLDIPESLAGSVSPGQRVVLTVDALPEREFEGTIRFVAPMIDPQTRTIRARAWLDNADGALRANMYARARIFTEAARPGVLVPRSAIQEAKGVQLVFVPLAEDEYETRRVRVAPGDGDLVAVTAGLSAGESIVTTGSFLLKTETLKGSIGAGCCEVEPPR